MTNALSFFDDPFNFESMPIFNTFFGDLQLMPKKFINSPKVNIKETDEAYEIEIANPGITKDQTEITVVDNVIYVSMNSEVKNKDEKEDEKYHVKEWSKSSYKESWNLPKNVNQDKITAKNVDGVLVITLPKKEKETEEKEVKTIDIK